MSELARYRILHHEAPRLAADSAIGALAEAIRAELVARTPRGPTGELASSWEVTTGRFPAVRLIRNDDPALKYVEYGTKNMRAEPFVAPVIAEVRAMVSHR